MMRIRLHAASLGCAVALALVAASAPAVSPVMAQTAQGAPVEGEVTRVQKDAGKVTIRHGPIPNLDMPGMTMVFTLKDPTWIDRLKVGSKVAFTADRVNGSFQVTSIQSIQ
jgi:Cu(I)/Ag(I) efflux system periplasmic protein CusF